MKDDYNFIDFLIKVYGISFTVLIIIIGLILYLFWNFINKKIEHFQNEITEKNLSKFKATLGKQIDAVHECYIKLDSLTSFVNFMHNGDRFYQPISLGDQLKILLERREAFKQEFNKNRLLFQTKTCTKVDQLFPLIDEFYDTFTNGLFHHTEEEKQLNIEANSGFYIAGLWSSNEFDKVISNLELLKSDIEKEFRNISGIN